jgi:AcrR family transcriptional regulator
MSLANPGGEACVHRVLVQELGEELAEIFGRARQAQEAVAQERRPADGLRERKRRLTRQRISDVATALFLGRGFDKVTVAEIAEVVGVSEKTVYNYFPTKESMVLETEDELVESLALAVRERDPGESLTDPVVRALKRDMERFGPIQEELATLFRRFGELLDSTPSLRAAWLELHNRLVAVARAELAARAEVDPRDPEPMIAARALVGLADVAFQSRVRHIERGLRGAALREAVGADLDRAARLLETGLRSFNLLTHGRRSRQQLLDAAKTADEARAQVVKALRQARAAWRELRDPGREAIRDQQAAKPDFKRAVSSRR